MVFSGLHARFIPTPVGNTTGSADARSGGRFIPTPVGNTRSHGFLRTARTVHPHACGEYDRICRCPFGRSVHPHACGEHYGHKSETRPGPGSSPRLWGTLCLTKTIEAIPRFIPTPVGNTFSESARRLPRSVHPHACGEHVESFAFFALKLGSSPRLWGTPNTFGAWHLWARFIPTPVGNTSDERSSNHPATVHPHACGEHSRSTFNRKFWSGSSPRLWGTRTIAGSGSSTSRFIPTPVGNTDRERP